MSRKFICAAVLAAVSTATLATLHCPAFEITLTPIDAQAETQNGTSYTLNPSSYSLNASRFSSTSLQRRGILEFPVGSIPDNATITSAVLDYQVNQFTSDGTNYGQFEFHGYAGNGVLTVADATVPFSLLGTSSNITALTAYSTTIPAWFVQNVVNGVASHLGIMTYQKNIGRQSSFYASERDEDAPGEGPRLTINYTLPPPPSPDIYVTHGSFSTQLHGFTHAGAPTGALTIPEPEGADGPGRGIVVDEKNRLHVFNGTFDPFISTYDLSSETWSHRTHSGFSVINNVSYGGVAAFRDYVFANDMATASGGEAKGIVRFNYADGTVQRFIEGSDSNDQFVGVTRGHDGLLYALSGFRVRAFQPISMTLVKDFYLGAGIEYINARAIAVNADGDVFAVSWDGNVYHLDDQGNVLDSLVLGENLSDIDLAADGKIVIGSWSDDVFLTDESLDTWTSFSTTGDALFVAFADPIQTTPGDSDFDGDVDLSDLGTLASSYGQTAVMGWHNGDFDGDHDVDLADLGALATNYAGGEAQAFADFNAFSSVPEPAISLAMLLIALPVRQSLNYK